MIPARCLLTHVRAVISILILLSICRFASASDSPADLPKSAIERSQITSPGSPVFVLKAKVLETTNPANSDYRAEIEEDWVAPDKWRRTVKTNEFSQLLVVNGEDQRTIGSRLLSELASDDRQGIL